MSNESVEILCEANSVDVPESLRWMDGQKIKNCLCTDSMATVTFECSNERHNIYPLLFSVVIRLKNKTE